eukprot:6476304-Amphidinium_carterae.1
MAADVRKTHDLLQRFHENLEVQRQRQASVSARNTLTGFGVANASADVNTAAARPIGRESPKENDAPFEVTQALLPSAVPQEESNTPDSLSMVPTFKSKATLISAEDDMCSVRVNAGDSEPPDASSRLRLLAQPETPKPQSRTNRLGKVLSTRSTRTGHSEEENYYNEEAPHGAMYPVGEDDSRLKERIQKAILKPNYNTHDQYRSSGVWQAVAKSYYFEQVTLFVIIFNSIWIGVDTDYNDADVILNASLEFQIVEQFFTVFFFSEWTVRWMAFRTWRYALQDGWFSFDSVLVFFMVLETWVMPGITLAAS